MSYSALTRLPASASADYDPLIGDDPLLEAWSALRQLRTTPFDAAESHLWRNAVRTFAQAACEAVSRHVVLAERENSFPRRLMAADGRSAAAAHAQLADHRHLLAEAYAFERRCRRIVAPVDDIWVVVDVTESAIVLEMTVARHRNRLVELLQQGEHSCEEKRWQVRARLEGGEAVSAR